MADVQLKIVDGPDTGREFEIGGALVIGRDPSAGLVVQDPEVSRRHASIAAGGGVAEVSDLGSTNGTFVNGERLDEPRTLQSGDRIRVGVTVFEVSVLVQATRMAAAIPDAGATAIASVATPEELERQLAEEKARQAPEPEPIGPAAAAEAHAELEHSESDDFPTIVPDDPEPPSPSAEPVADVGAPTEAGPGGAGVPSPQPVADIGAPTEAGPGGAGVPSPQPVADIGAPTEAGPGGAGVPSPQPVADVGAPTTAGPGAAGVPAPTPPAGTPAPPPPPPPAAAPPPPPPPVPGAQPPPVPGAQPFGQPPPFSAPPAPGADKPGLLRRIFRRGGS